MDGQPAHGEKKGEEEKERPQALQRKGGMIAMNKSFAKEGAARNIRFNCVTPGFIETDMTSELSDEIKKTYSDNIPLKRFGSASEVAEAVAFLLSNHASYVTGETLKINGGLYM